MPIKAFVEIHREAFQMAQRVCESPDYDGTGRIMWDGGSYAGELVKLLAQAKLSEAERERMAAEAEAEKKKTAERTAARLAAQTARAEKKKADAEKKKLTSPEAKAEAKRIAKKQERIAAQLAALQKASAAEKKKVDGNTASTTKKKEKSPVMSYLKPPGTGAPSTFTTPDKKAPACNEYRVDVKASGFGICVCGRPQAEHSAKARSKRPASKKKTREGRIHSKATKPVPKADKASKPATVTVAPSTPRKATKPATRAVTPDPKETSLVPDALSKLVAVGIERGAAEAALKRHGGDLAATVIQLSAALLKLATATAPSSEAAGGGDASTASSA